MDAPTYGPAIAFEQPISSSYVMQLENTSLAELMSVPAAWDIVTLRLPTLKFAAQTSALRPYLDLMTVPDFSVFTRKIPPEMVASINEELARLPPVESSR